MTVTKQADGTYMLTPETGDARVLADAVAELGAGALAAVVNGWLRARRDARRRSSGLDALADFALVPAASVDAAVDGIAELTTDQKTRLKDNLKALR